MELEQSIGVNNTALCLAPSLTTELNSTKANRQEIRRNGKTRFQDKPCNGSLVLTDGAYVNEYCSSCPALVKSLSTKYASQFRSKRSTNTRGLLVIGVGQMRTGTTSLKYALQKLYAAPCYHMSDVAFHFKQAHIRQWIRAIESLRDAGPAAAEAMLTDRAFWDELFGEHRCAVDYPTCLFYKQFSKIYPDAKFILTIRDPDDWVRSCRATTLCDNMVRNPTVGERIYRTIIGAPDLPKLHRLMFAQALGSEYAQLSDQQLKDAYCRWNQSVIDTIPADRLLIFDTRTGWGPLCKFLSLSPPVDSQKFPHLNKREDMSNRLEKFYGVVRVFDLIICLVAVCSFLLLTYSILPLPDDVA